MLLFYLLPSSKLNGATKQIAKDKHVRVYFSIKGC
jgi:hypothetical protein